MILAILTAFFLLSFLFAVECIVYRRSQDKYHLAECERIMNQINDRSREHEEKGQTRQEAHTEIPTT